MGKIPYVRLLNRERGDRWGVMLAEPKSFDLHWDAEGGPKGRTKLCPVHLYRLRGIEPELEVCRWCIAEKEPRGYWFVPLVVPGMVETGEHAGKKAWALSIAQVPLALIATRGTDMQRGQKLHVLKLNMPGAEAVWQIGERWPEPVPEVFDMVAALMRIKGMKELPPLPSAGERPDLLAFRPRKYA